MKKIYIAIAATMIASICIFFACGKEENETAKSKNNKNEIIVGFLSKNKNGDNSIEPTFEKNAYLHRLENALNKIYDSPIVAEDIELYFDKVRENTTYPMMKISYLNVYENAFYTTFFQLKEKEISTKDKALFNSSQDICFSVSDDENGYCICRGQNCQDGCQVLRDEKDRPYGCSDCKNRKGKCNSQIKVPYTTSAILASF